MVKPEGEVFIETFVEHAELARQLGRASTKLTNINRFLSGQAQPLDGLAPSSSIQQVQALTMPLVQEMEGSVSKLLSIQGEADERFLGRKVAVSKIGNPDTTGIFSGHWQYARTAKGTLTQLLFDTEYPGLSVTGRPNARLRSKQIGYILALTPPKTYEDPRVFPIVPIVEVAFVR